MAAKTATVTTLNTTPSFTASQLRDMLKQAEEHEAKLAAEKGEEIRQELATLVQTKYGLSLEAIGLVEKTARNMPAEVFYKNPKTGDIYRYKGFGGIAKDVKTWLCDKDGKRIEAYRCNEDGNPYKAANA